MIKELAIPWLIFAAHHPTTATKIMLDPDLEHVMKSSKLIPDAINTIQASKTEKSYKSNSLPTLWDLHEAYLSLGMDDSIQSTGEKLLNSPDTAFSCSYSTAITTATSAYRSGRTIQSRNILESIASRCPNAHLSTSFREFYSRPLSNLVARILSRENKGDSSLLILAPWINDGLSIVAYRLTPQALRGDLCKEIDLALAKGLHTNAPRPQASSPLFKILFSANSSPYERSIRLENFNFSIPIYTDPAPPTQQALTDAISRLKSNFFYTGNDCDIKSIH